MWRNALQSVCMIIGWRHKGLKRFFETGSLSGIQAEHSKRLKVILQRLNAAIKPEDMDSSGMRFHRLTGKMKGSYSVTVNKNWRVVFKFTGQDATLVDYLDYH